MYLVVVAVDTGGGRTPAEVLRQAVYDSAADTDRLQHVYLEARQGTAIFSIYLLAADGQEALRLAEQLCRRTMAASAEAGSGRFNPRILGRDVSPNRHW